MVEVTSSCVTCYSGWFADSDTAYQVNKYWFPILNRIACDYLAIQGSSVPCKRASSPAGLTDDKCRGHLLPEHFEDIQTVKGKYKKERREQREFKEAKHAMERQRWVDRKSVV